MLLTPGHEHNQGALSNRKQSVDEADWSTLASDYFAGSHSPISSNLLERAPLPEIIDTLTDILESDRPIKVHPLGFAQIPITSGEHRHDTGLRLNLWPRGYKLEDGNDIHAHTFAMTSHVLHGGIVNYEFDWRDYDGGSTAIGEITHGDDKKHFLTDTGRRGEYRAAEPVLSRAGDEYHVPKGRFHTTSVEGNELTITLIDRYDVDPDAPNLVISTTGLEQPVVYDQRPLSQDDVRDLVRQAVEVLRTKEQHQLLETEPHRELLKVLGIPGRKVVELGVGGGALTELILERNPCQVIGYEIAPEQVPPRVAEAIDLKAGDFRKEDFSYLAEGDCCLIANPPYSYLPYIRDEIIDRYNLRDVVLLIPEAERNNFLDFETAATLEGSAFEPETGGRHLIVYRGFGTTDEHFIDSPLGTRERDLRQALSEKLGLDSKGKWSEQDLLQSMVSKCQAQIVQLGKDEKLGRRRRVVVFLSENPNKLPEWRRNFSRYGVEVVTADNFEHPQFVRELLGIDLENVRILNVIREASNLYRAGSETLSTRQHREAVENVSILTSYRLQNDRVTAKVFSHSTKGIIDHDRRDASDSTVFGWDDVFVVSALGDTYHDLRKRGHKVSSRDMVVADYIKARLYYGKKVDLNFNPQDQHRTVDFGNSVESFLSRNPYISNPAVEQVGLLNLFRRVVNEGVFFRSAKNRREKNYWLAALNGGLPFTPKRDPVHEAKYAVHDMGHMDIYEPLYTGHESPSLAPVYCAARMMSEAFTLVEADMIFPFALAQGGVDYDFSKHESFPLFTSLGLDIITPEGRAAQLRRLFHANARYCLCGDDSEYRALLAENGQGFDALEQYKAKFMPFFVEDYRWTVRNWENMAGRQEEFQKWWSIVKPVRDAAVPDLITVEEFAADLGQYPGDLVDQVFEKYFQTRIVPAFTEEVQFAPRGEQLASGFRRYMMGQMGLFARYDFAPGAQAVQQSLNDALIEYSDSISLAEIERLRGFYEQFVERLRDCNLITPDDAATYKEIYPLFDPFYVFYDEKSEFYEDLSTISARQLNGFKRYERS